MKIGFFGTPELAARVLADLARDHEVRFAVTAGDRPAGRNRELQFCHAKRKALDLDIPVLQPAGLKELKDQEFQERLRAFGADIFVVVAYGNLIPRAVFDLPPLRTLNLHPSLLPKYRGAAPIQWSLINGERETGITVQLINEKLDAGDIVVQDVIALDGVINAAGLTEIVASRGAEIIGRAARLLATGSAAPLKQDESQATFCGKIDRDTAMIDWTRPADEIHNRVRGLNPKPVAFTLFRGDHIKIWKTAPMEGEAPENPGPGMIVRFQKKRLLAGTGTGPIEIMAIQPANKKLMDGLSFINGYRLAEGERFGQ
jgi:methionyl-tRNA formyltransferase